MTEKTPKTSSTRRKFLGQAGAVALAAGAIGLTPALGDKESQVLLPDVVGHDLRDGKASPATKIPLLPYAGTQESPGWLEKSRGAPVRLPRARLASDLRFESSFYLPGGFETSSPRSSRNLSLTTLAFSGPIRISTFWPAELDSSLGSAN